MEAKSREAEKLYVKFEHLKPFNDDSTNEADDESSSSSEEENHRHALQDLLDAHVDEENLRSQRRVDKMLSEVTFKPDVQAMWDQLEQGLGNKVAQRNSLVNGKNYSQVQSVPLSAATKKFIRPSKIKDVPMQTSVVYHETSKQSVARYVSPYKEPAKMLHLICNESLVVDSTGLSIPLNVSISYEYNPPTDDAATAADGRWIYELYNPCDGSVHHYKMNDDEFSLFNTRCKSQMAHSTEPRESNKIVHRQKVERDGSCFLYAVVVSLNEGIISAAIHRSKCHYKVDQCNDITSLDDDFEVIVSLRVGQVLKLLVKHHVYSITDEEFWMKDNNAQVLWNPLIDLIKDGSKALEDDDALVRSAVAGDSWIVLKRMLEDRDGRESFERIFFSVQRPNKSRTSDDVGKTNNSNAPLLSMRISNHSPYLSTICPGHTVVWKRPGVWRLSQPIVEEQSNTLFPIWLTDAKYPAHLDKTQASAYIYYKSLGPNRGVSVTSLSRLAFESPVYSPYCYAVDRGFIVPPFFRPELVDGVIPTIELPCKSLLEYPVNSRFDTLLPPTIVVLDPAAAENDWIDAPRDRLGNVFHIRNEDELNRDGFRIKTFAHEIEYDNTIKSRVYGISEKAAIPNSKATAPVLTHKSTDCCTQYLSRKRTAMDYHYIAENDGQGTISVPYLFASHLKAYKPIHVSRKSTTSYRDEEQFLIATKEAEAKKADIALKIKAAEEIAEARLRKKMEKIHQSIGLTMPTPSDEIGLPLTMHKANDTEPDLDAVAESDVETAAPQQENPAEEVNDLDQMANILLNNTNFLRAIARKLNISEDVITLTDPESVPKTNSSNGAQSNPKNDEDGTVPPRKDETILHQESPVPTLDLGRKTYQGENIVGLKGDGWKRLPRADTLVGEFRLTSRKVKKNKGPPKFDGFEGRRNFFAVNAVDEIRYIEDPKSYGIKTTTMFIADLATERLRLSRSQRQQKHYEKSLLSEDQKFSLQEILQIPVSSCQQVVERNANGFDEVDNNDAIVEYDMTEHSTDQDFDSLDPVTRAILAVKNHNLPHLERILDTDGVSVETRDQHGNTLFILAAQQGSKRLAKFLLRRGADINAQNNGGNTALHYLHEYHHKLLAEYLIRKGANDALRNADGLTVYEGVTLEDDMDE
jgi:transcription termination factor NusB